MIKSFRELQVWQKAHQLALDVFKLTDGFPHAYRFDLTSQLRRAALSIPTNIAEGCATPHSKELMQFLNIAKRSVSEAQYLLCFACEQRLLKKDQLQQLEDRYEEVSRMLGGLRRSLSVTDSSSRHSSLITGHS